jgi:hypothetical protein
VRAVSDAASRLRRALCAQASTINPVERMKSISAELTAGAAGELSEEQLERSVALLGARLRGACAARGEP